jgi:hypothetical protein
MEGDIEALPDNEKWHDILIVHRKLIAMLDAMIIRQRRRRRRERRKCSRKREWRLRAYR